MKYLLILACTCHALLGAAQKYTGAPGHAVTIGDKVPNFTFKRVINYPSSTARLSDFKGKLIILDLWSTWCTSCIEAFPKMQALQDKFKDKVQVVLADSYSAADDPDEKVKWVLNRVKQRTGFSISVPVALHDTMLNNLFPHKSISHVVLIDSTGRVKAITYTSALTDENIQSILTGQNIHLPVKNDWSYDRDSPLFINGNGGDESDFTYRSVITPFKEGLGSVIGNDVDSNDMLTRFYVVNYPLIALFRIAYPDAFLFPQNRIINETGDSSKFFQYHNEQEDYKNSYCYEVDAAAATKAAMLQYMREDLYRNFHVIARNEERKITCYVLKLNNAFNTSQANADSAEMDIEKTSLHKFIHNKPVAQLTAMLNDVLSRPVINETGLAENISIDFPFNIYSYNDEQWRDLLATKGIDMIKEEKKLEVTIITNRQ